MKNITKYSFTKEQLEIPYEKLPNELIFNVNYSIERGVYDQKKGVVIPKMNKNGLRNTRR